MNKQASIISYPKFKLIIVILLASNIGIYAVFDTLLSALDALVWLLLLVLYELEANGISVMTEVQLKSTRSCLIALIILVFVGYIQEREWLDVANAIFWFVLIALLEMEVRRPEKVYQYRKSYLLATVFVFAGLIAMVILWAWHSAWLDVYDATLWIVAFGCIEVDIIRFVQSKLSSDLA